ncbi:MAG: hypothetical protein ACI9KE_001458 [Polyangiales bacterium]|jgi:hypothetical protein
MNRFKWTLTCVLLSACSTTPDFEASCAGEAVVNCLPFEASIIDSATVTPDRVTVDDLTTMASIRVQLSICPDAPRPHEIVMELREGEGEGARLVELLMLRDDGMTEGDSLAGDGLIDVDLVNPFLGMRVPENEDVFLRFTARAPADCTSGTCRGGTCRSEEFEIPYRTGARFMMP